MSLQNIIASLLDKIINPLIGILIGAGIVFFLWGVVNYLFLMSGDVKKKDDAKKFMLWGIIVLTVMFSVWGIIQLLQGIFLGGADFSKPPQIPGAPTRANQELQVPDYSQCPYQRCDYTLPLGDPCACSLL